MATPYLTLDQLAAREAITGRNPSERSQIIDSANLKASPYAVKNWLEYGNGQGVAGDTKQSTPLYAGHQYTMVDNKTGEILAQGSTPEEIQKIQALADSLHTTQGHNADWRLYDATPQAGLTNMHEKMPGAYSELSAPGDPRGVVVAGDMPNNFLKDELIPFLTPLALAAGSYFGGNALLGALGGGGSTAAALPAVAEVGSLAPAAMASLPANLAAVGAGAQASLGAAGLGSLAAAAPTVAAAAPAVAEVGSLAPGAMASLPANLAAVEAGANASLGAAGLGGGLLGGLTPAQIKAYADLASLGVSTVGSLFGGKGGAQAAGKVPGGLGGGLNPIFSAKLPTAPTGIPGGVGTAANFAARPQTEQDWLTYGQRPEQSFFNYVPQQPKGMAHGGSLEAKGGGKARSTFAVNGPGTGRSDDIPAVLSDGEYVMDAETVALLGDGSSKAGAKKLDDLRVKVRKHKGQKLAKGRFSANAKSPEAYLSGGRI